MQKPQDRRKISVYDMVVVGLLSAMIFVATLFLRIPISTPTGPTQLKIANGLCLLFAILFGKWRGGLAAGLGSMFFDLFSEYIDSAPFTLINFFLMAFVCGLIAHSGGAGGKRRGRNLVAAILGAATYLVLYFSKQVITVMLLGSAFVPAVLANLPKLATSSINAVFAVIVAAVLGPILRRELEKAGVFRRLGQ